MDQGTDEWKMARCGKITASRFKDVMTNGRGKDTMGQTAYSYMKELIAEILTGRPADEVQAKAIDWGHEHEPAARAFYCLHKHVRVVKAGLIQHPSYTNVAGSPDGLVESSEDGPGGVEIKCPFNSRNHISYLEVDGVPPEYEWQVQGLMWLTQRQWWDFVSYDPRLEDAGLHLYVYRVRADKEMHEDLERRIIRFNDQLYIKLNKIRSKAIDFNK